MNSFKERMEDWYDDLDTDPDKKKFLVILGILGAVLIVFLFIFIAFNLTKHGSESSVRAAELVSGDEAGDERNDAGGLIADINWDSIIGYDRDGNPIYGTNGLDADVGGYDMCGAPILKEKMNVIGTSDDGLPIYDYSARDEARIRGIRDGKNPDIDWNTVVGYDRDGNPIFGTNGADANILGYDMLGNPIYKGSVRVSSRTDSGLPIYDYSTIEVARQLGRQQQDDLKNGRRATRSVVVTEAGTDVIRTSAYGTDGTDGQNGQGDTGFDGKDGSNRYGNNGMQATDGKDGRRGSDGKSGQDGQDAEGAQSGSRGRNGMNAPDGKDGRNGKKGPRGDKGPAGSNGSDGTNAASGKNGTSGTSGQRGNNGANGSSGNSGKDGKDGSYGNRGYDGYNGMSGADGKDGRSGANGTSGNSGTNGTSGERGADGQRGSTGQRGEKGRDGWSMYLHVRYSLGSPIGKQQGQVPLYTEEQMRSITASNNNTGDYSKANPEYEWWVGTYSDYEKDKCSDDPTDYQWMMLTDMTVHPTNENNVDKLIITDVYD